MPNVCNGSLPSNFWPRKSLFSNFISLNLESFRVFTVMQAIQQTCLAFSELTGDWCLLRQRNMNSGLEQSN